MKSIGYHWERKMNAKRDEKKRAKKRAEERFLKELPDCTQSWMRNGCVIQAFVVRSGFWLTGYVDTFFRIGSMRLTDGQPAFSPTYHANRVSDYLAMLGDVEAWHGSGTPATVRRKISALHWKCACEAMKPIITIDCLPVVSIGRVQCNRYETLTDSGVLKRNYRISVPREKHHAPNECEHFFKLFDFFAIKELLNTSWNELCNTKFALDTRELDASESETSDSARPQTH